VKALQAQPFRQYTRREMQESQRALSAVAPASVPNVTGVRVQPGPIRLAVIDTDSGFVRVLAKRVGEMGWQHRVLTAPPRAEDLLSMRLHALIVDLALLGSSGWEFLEQVCDSVPGLGVIVCTGSSSVAQRVRGLRIGADDWITKPCHPQEVIARVEAVVRRRKRSTPGTTEDAPLLAGELEIRADQFQAFVGGQSIDLTRREFELLHLLAKARGRVLERDEIYQHVWGYAMVHGDRSVDVFVRKVRQKVERFSPGWTYIHTHFGIGYRFEPEAPEDEPPESPVDPLDDASEEVESSA
jgi:DNA-binding response OmpR family regulator